MAASRSLTNIATGTQAQTETVLLAVPNILQVISNNLVAGLHEQLCWIIGNIAGDADEFRVVLAANGAIEAVIRLTLQESVAKKEHSCLKTALWTLSNLARGSTDISLFFVEGNYYTFL